MNVVTDLPDEWFDTPDLLESRAFYELMQAYRTAPMANQPVVIDAFETVKQFVRNYYCQRSQA